ncbi:hypothetical protein ASG01_14835 [Chryseobacterium sp. Leaf180]|uniref:DUF1440 domain-containing protein n=1 Tax=Chryseobacterium sp. Leaf180 TaxID=1736289 RepID=UPI0006FDDC8B|nr:DUF1440 domain-containing protein [Chryseobacterium sp. Leaf180]KQR90838.1 hypothetical protein ASG01_14835 [Chryseobacterium sp. Leaf180]
MNTLTKTLITGVAAGLFASWIKSIAEPPLQKIGEEKFPPSDKELKLKGADVTNQPENMPPAVLANSVAEKISGHRLSKEETLASMKAIHYGLGTAIGVGYVLISERYAKISSCEGIAAGGIVWAMTHGSVVPAFGLQGKVGAMPKSWWVWEFGSHLIFGIALEQSRKVLNKIL